MHVKANHATEDFDEVLRGKHVRTFHSCLRSKRDDSYVELSLKESDVVYHLKPGPGWRLVSAMINTLRFAPEITGISIKRRADMVILEINAYGMYKVAELIYRMRPGADAKFSEAIQIEEKPDA